MSQAPLPGRFVLEILWEESSLLARFSDSRAADKTLHAYLTQGFDEKEVHEAVRRIWTILRTAAKKGSSTDLLHELERVGQSLFDRLFPEDIRIQIQSFPSNGSELRLLLDEECVHIPWELLNDGSDFLCCRFALGRTIRTTSVPRIARRAPGLKQIEFVIVSNPTGDLPSASEEGENLCQELSGDGRIGIEWFNREVSVEMLVEVLPDFDVLHFCGHGEHDALVPKRSGWLLRGGRFSAETIEEYSKGHKPLPRFVFNNACCGAETEAWNKEDELSCYGLVHAFLLSGCQHYLGPVSPLSDDSGKRFANRFYRHALSGITIGSAIQQARLEVRSQYATESMAWAQYVLYGDPEEFLIAQPCPRKSITHGDGETKPQVFALAFSEVVGATSLLEKSGFVHTNEAIHKFRKVVEGVLSEFEEGWLVGSFGERQVYAFSLPSESVRFALICLARLRELEAPLGDGLSIRLGLHIGEVILKQSDDPSFPHAVEGPSVDIAERILRIARPGQILLSRPVFDNVRSALHTSDLKGLSSVAWVDHGPYRIQGLEHPIGVCEVGEKYHAPLSPPEDSPIASRYLTSDQEPVLGWRPALEQVIPTAPNWTLTERLGSGGFGEVWRARNIEGDKTQVFKFCFWEDKVRSLKREASLFKLLKGGVAGHSHIVQVLDVYFEEPPYYIGLEDFGGVDLGSWCIENGGCSNVPLETRLEIVIQAAEGLQAAHDVGIIHRDVKPSNILVGSDPDGLREIEIKLTDFGVGQIVSRELLAPGLSSGFTETFSATEMGSIAGSRLYMAPEALAGKPASTRSDIYALGVILYQLLIGDLSQPLAGDWGGLIEDDLLAEDLSRCLAGDPGSRFQSAGQLAASLRLYERRRYEKGESEVRDRKVTRRRRLLGALAATAIAVSLLAIGLGYGLIQEHRAHIEADEATHRAESELYISSLQQIESAMEDLRFDRAQEILLSCPITQRNWEWGHLLAGCNQDLSTFRGHTDEVGAVAYGPDGSWLVSCSSDGTVRMWDVRSGSELRRFEGHTKPVWNLAVSPDGKTIATGSEDKTAILWDAQSGRPMHVLAGHQDHVESVAFSPDGRLLATGGREPTVRIWDVSSGKEKDRLSFKDKEEVNALAFSPDGTQIAESVGFFPSLYSNPESVVKMIRLVDLSTKEVRWEISDPENARSIAFDAQGMRLAAGLGNDAKVWDLENRELLWHFKGHENPVWCVAFSEEGDFLATASIDRTIRFWDLTVGETFRTLKGHSRAVYSICFDPSGRMLASSSEDGTLKVWDSSVDSRRDILRGHDGGISSLAFSPDGKIIVSAGERLSQDQERMVNLWNPQTGKRERTIGGFSDQPNALSISPDGNTLCVGTNDCMLWTVDLGSDRIREKAKVTTLSGLPILDNIVACPISPDGKRIAVGLHNGEISVWKALPLTKISSVSTLAEKGILSFLTWSPDGRSLLCSGGRERTMDTASIEYRDSDSLQLLRTMPAHAYDVRDLVFSRDGKFFATASMDATAKLWSADGSEEPKVLQGHRDYLTSLVFTPDGTRLVTGSIDKTAKMWRLDKDRPRETLDLKGAHSEEIDKLAISPDGRIIATGSLDKTIHLWRSFPWKWEDYPGSAEDDPMDRIERYKRSLWLKE